MNWYWVGCIIFGVLYLLDTGLDWHNHDDEENFLWALYGIPIGLGWPVFGFIWLGDKIKKYKG